MGRFLVVILAIFFSIGTLQAETFEDLGYDLPDETEVFDIPHPDDVKAAQEEVEKLFPLRNVKVSKMQTPTILAKYSHIYPSQVIPNDLLEDALVFFDMNKAGFTNQNYITIVDFEKHSWKKRLFIIDMKSGEVLSKHMGHGSGGDRDNDGYVERLSNINNSHMSSEGFYRVAESYYGKYGYSARLDGLSDTNSRARARAIVMHGANYILDQNVKQGRSWGCITISFNRKNEIVDMLRGGSLLYAAKSKE